ncbi:MAG: hypothetical protein O7C55_01030 [Rickettsia endosymbiont of Ixodes persulcatus]|nr:hypothetical protein [Rickettsia endosymbiont of Ixodes persulcatus]
MSKSNEEKETKYRVTGWVTPSTYKLMQQIKKEFIEKEGIKLTQGLLIDHAFKIVEKQRQK